MDSSNKLSMKPTRQMKNMIRFIHHLTVQKEKRKLYCISFFIVFYVVFLLFRLKGDLSAIERGGINNNNNNNNNNKFKSVKSLPILTNSFITISLDELLY